MSDDEGVVLATEFEDVAKEEPPPQDAKTINANIVINPFVLMDSLSISNYPITIRKHHKS
jgi:hypothetical protein